jgi:hypothetical protein
MGERVRRSAYLLLLVILAACGSHDQQGSANAVTRAVYENDLSGVTSYFDDALKAQVSRASLGLLSDKMHALGDYEGLSLLATDPAKHEYTYKASFTKGAMNVVVRVDGDGKLAAYRVFPV